jgi:hypothetical protein
VIDADVELEHQLVAYVLVLGDIDEVTARPAVLGALVDDLARDRSRRSRAAKA